MSHEIRTPMNTVKLGIDLLRKEMQDTGLCTADMLNILGDITDSSEVIIDLVSDILTNDKIMKGTLQLNKTRNRIWNILKTASKPFVTQVTVGVIKHFIRYIFSYLWVTLKFFVYCLILIMTGTRFQNKFNDPRWWFAWHRWHIHRRG